jgi:hypothetical protein
MKQIKLLFTAFLLFFGSSSFAASSDIFSYDEEAIAAEFSALSELENFLAANPHLTFEEAKAVNPMVFSNIKIASIVAPEGMAFTIDDMEWGSFAWGFCCWPIGFFVVILNPNKDSAHKISYLIGLGVNILFSLPGYYLTGGAYRF